MIRSKPLLALLSLSAAAVLIGAAKPAPQPAAFTPALAYRYAAQEVRLANADGSAAVLLARFPLAQGLTASVTQLAIAPLSLRQVAFIDISYGVSESVRIVGWNQAIPGGALTVTLDPTPLFTIQGSPAAKITSLDYSPDGSKLAVVSHIDGRNNEVRVFDVASRTQIGDTVPLADFAQVIRWRAFDDSLLLRGSTGVSKLKDGVQTLLFADPQGLPFDTFNGPSPEAVFRFHDARGNTIQRWDGVTVNSGQAAYTKVTDGIDPSMSCDNTQMIYTRLSPKTTIAVRSLSTGAEQQFSNDRSISFPAYPNGCV
jgi:WD40 repeat protein